MPDDVTPQEDFLIQIEFIMAHTLKLLKDIRGLAQIGTININFTEMAMRFEEEVFSSANAIRGPLKAGDYIFAKDVYYDFRQHIKSNCIPFIKEATKHSAAIQASELDPISAVRLIEQSISQASSAIKLITKGNRATPKSKKPTVPKELPAPIRVKIHNNRIVLEHTQTAIGLIDFASADRIRASIVEALTDVIDDLENNSNIDRRFIRPLKALNKSLLLPLQHSSIEAIGLNVQLANIVTNAVKEELNSIIAAQLDHILKTAAILLAQFQEWSNFLAESEKIDVKSIDSSYLVGQTKLLIKELELHSDVIDKSISARFKEMTGPVTSGIITADTIVPALMPSLSNLFGAMSELIIDVTTKIGSEPVPAAILGGGMILAVICKKIILEYFPLFTAFKPLRFIADVIDFTAKYFSPLALMLS